MFDLKARLAPRLRRWRRNRRLRSALSEKSAAAVTQRLLAEQYRLTWRTTGRVPSIEDAAFREFSQNGEDGILLLLFSILGMGGRRVVEICAGDGIECNAANLIVNHGWEALLVEGDPRLVAAGRRFYAEHGNTRIWPPRIVHGWITAENVNETVTSNKFAGEIDLLSLDLDGMDYWIWKALNCVQPRVVVVEYQTAWGPERSMAVRYDADFRPREGQGAGASLAAFVKLGSTKGFRLVACERYGFNAFFLREDIGRDAFPTTSPSMGFQHPHARWCMDRASDVLKLYDWIEIA